MIDRILERTQTLNNFRSIIAVVFLKKDTFHNKILRKQVLNILYTIKLKGTVERGN